MTNHKKVVQLFAGCLPPNACGIGDYTLRLQQLLENSWIVHASVLNRKTMLASVFQYRDAIHHLQYPSQGFKKSIVPHLTAILLSRLVVTLHERTQLRFELRVLIYIFLLFSKRLIVTTEHEYHALPWWAQKKAHIIPVIAAMPAPQVLVPAIQRHGVCFFGLTQKGETVEHFFKVASYLRAKGYKDRIAYVSAVLPHAQNYLEELQSQFSGLNIDWHLNLDLTNVSTVIGDFKFSYLHFPDGISNRRSSYITLLSHGVLVLSNSGHMTDSNMLTGFVPAKNPLEAASLILELNLSISDYSTKYRQAQQVAFLYSSSEFLRAHENIYNSIKS